MVAGLSHIRVESAERIISLLQVPPLALFSCSISPAGCVSRQRACAQLVAVLIADAQSP